MNVMRIKLTNVVFSEKAVQIGKIADNKLP